MKFEQSVVDDCVDVANSVATAVTNAFVGIMDITMLQSGVAMATFPYL